VRGVAILLVLVHHFVIYAQLSRENVVDRYVYILGEASWIGVDVFFVLSGFLITGVLYDTKGSPGFFRKFYGRRTLRIFPLYYGVLAAVFLAPSLLLGHPLTSEARWEQLWHWTYLSNVDVALHGWQEPIEIGHFWSLAVEEQFYLVWPVVVFAFARAGLLRIAVVCLVGALALRSVLPLWLDPLSVYVLMPTRMALAAGAFVALAARGPSGWAVFGPWPRRVLVTSLGFLAAIFLWRRGLREVDVVVRTVGYSVIAVGTASLIALAMTSGSSSRLRKALSSRILVALGTYSYGLYVFHHIVVLRMRDLGFSASRVPTLWGSEIPGLVVFAVVAMTASSLLAYLSWHLWEMPFLRLKRHFAYATPAGEATVAGGHFGDAPESGYRSGDGPQR
jgi:peptidoglycan/LPS O-acetylase OafA/YrhL